MIRRRFVPLLWLLALVAVADTAVWFGACWRIEAGFRRWEREAGGQGWHVSHAPYVRGGWPLAARVTVPGLGLSGPGAALNAAAVTIGLALAHPLRLAFTVSGRSSLRLAGLALDVEAHQLRVLVPFGGGKPLRVQATGLALTPGIAGPTLRIGALAAQLAGRPGAGLAVAAHASSLVLPPGPLLPRGATLEGARLAATVAPSPGSVASAAAWRAAGGRVAIAPLHLRAGVLVLDARLHLHLDSALQPAGGGTTTLRGAAAALDRAARAGTLPAGSATALKAMLSLLGDTGAPGGKDRIALPLLLHAGLLTLGGLPILRLPPLAWPR
ncbi:MAG: DUF2125 domain-containing protein [Acetobacteraceae bacterium]